MRLKHLNNNEYVVEDEEVTAVTTTAEDPDEDNPLWLLLREYRTETGRINLEELKAFSSREDLRAPALGNAVVYGLDGKIMDKAILKNLSPGGVGLEVGPINIIPRTSVIVDFQGPHPCIGAIRCQVQWVAKIPGHRDGNKLVGLRFLRVSSNTKKKLDDYFKDLRRFGTSI